MLSTFIIFVHVNWYNRPQFIIFVEIFIHVKQFDGVRFEAGIRSLICYIPNLYNMSSLNFLLRRLVWKLPYVGNAICTYNIYNWFSGGFFFLFFLLGKKWCITFTEIVVGSFKGTFCWLQGLQNVRWYISCWCVGYTYRLIFGHRIITWRLLDVLSLGRAVESGSGVRISGRDVKKLQGPSAQRGQS